MTNPDDDVFRQATWDKRQGLLLRAIANRMYQQHRQNVFEWLENLVKAFSLIFGTTAFANVSNPSLVKFAAAVIVAASILSLVFTWGAKSRDAAKRRDDWIDLEKDIRAAGEYEFGDELAGWDKRAVEIEAGEGKVWEQSFEKAEASARRILDMK